MRLKTGFTLAELLVALVILGLIAKFTLPKILSGQADAKKKAVFRESIAAMKKAFYYGVQAGEVDDGNFGTYMMDHMNHVKRCNTNAISQGCWSPDVDPAGQGTLPGIVLHNGACLCGLDDWDGGTGADTLALDWNCLEGPNVEGNDVLRMRAYLDNTSTSDRYGTIRVDSPGSASHNLWEEIFKN